MLNVEGQKIYEVKEDLHPGQHLHEVMLGDIAPGVYMIELQIEGVGKVSKKFVKQ